MRLGRVRTGEYPIASPTHQEFDNGRRGIHGRCQLGFSCSRLADVESGHGGARSRVDLPTAGVADGNRARCEYRVLLQLLLVRHVVEPPRPRQRSAKPIFRQARVARDSLGIIHLAGSRICQAREQLAARGIGDRPGRLAGEPLPKGEQLLLAFAKRSRRQFRIIGGVVRTRAVLDVPERLAAVTTVRPRILLTMQIDADRNQCPCPVRGCPLFSPGVNGAQHIAFQERQALIDVPIAPRRSVLGAPEAVECEVLKRQPRRILRPRGERAERLPQIDLESSCLRRVAHRAFADQDARPRVDVFVDALVCSGDESRVIP
jgi:hypothetical protein